MGGILLLMLGILHTQIALHNCIIPIIVNLEKFDSTIPVLQDFTFTCFTQSGMLKLDEEAAAEKVPLVDSRLFLVPTKSDSAKSPAKCMKPLT